MADNKEKAGEDVFCGETIGRLGVIQDVCNELRDEKDAGEDIDSTDKIGGRTDNLGVLQPQTVQGDEKGKADIPTSKNINTIDGLGSLNAIFKNLDDVVPQINSNAKIMAVKKPTEVKKMKIYNGGQNMGMLGGVMDIMNGRGIEKDKKEEK